MNSSRFLSSSFCLLLLLVFLHVLGFSALSQVTTNSDVYRTCRDHHYRCGNLTAGFPFWGGDRIKACGHPQLKLECDKNTATTGIQIEERGYNVLRIDSEAQVVKIASKNYMDGLCPSVLLNTTINGSRLFHYITGYTELKIHYNCTYQDDNGEGHWDFNCPKIDGFNYYHQGDYDVFTTCTDNITVVVADKFFSAMEVGNLKKALKEGFEVKVKVDGEACGQCVESNGTCGFAFLNQVCYCGYPSESDSRTCSSPLVPAPSQSPSPAPSLGSGGRWGGNVNHSWCLQCQESGGYCQYNERISRSICHCKDNTSFTTCHLTADQTLPIGSSGNRNLGKKVAIGTRNELLVCL